MEYLKIQAGHTYEKSDAGRDFRLITLRASRHSLTAAASRGGEGVFA